MNAHPSSAAAAIKARSFFSSTSAFASAIGKSPQFVYQLLAGTRRIPAELCPLIEQKTKKKILCEEMRPDVSWGVLREQATQTEEHED